jgi:hypothetical protein
MQGIDAGHADTRGSDYSPGKSRRREKKHGIPERTSSFIMRGYV